MRYPDGKTAWITGASSGIGKALALEMARRTGGTLVLSARNMEELEKVAEACLKQNPAVKVHTHFLDLADHAGLPHIVARVLQQVNAVDILVNNAGVSQRSLAEDTVYEVDRRLLDVNLLGTITLSKALLPHFLERNSGHYVVVSSLMGVFGSPWRSTYSAAKHGLHGFFESLRAETWSRGIIVTVLCPGFVTTNVSVNALTADGTPLGVTDDLTVRGITQEAFAKKALQAIRRRKEEVYIGKKEVLGAYLKRYTPGLFSRIIRKARVR